LQQKYFEHFSVKKIKLALERSIVIQNASSSGIRLLRIPISQS